MFKDLKNAMVKNESLLHTKWGVYTFLKIVGQVKIKIFFEREINIFFLPGRLGR